MDRPAILITGAASRLGAAMTRRFGAGGWHVVIHHRHHPAEAEALTQELPSAEVVSFDLADRAAIEATVADLAARLGDWRGLICNASAFRPDTPLAPDPEIWEAMIAGNLAGNLWLASGFVAQAQAAGGRRVVNLLDQKLANMNPDFFSYTVAKAGLAAAGTMLGMAVGGDDRVYGLYPGITLPSHDQTAQEFAAAAPRNLLRRLNSAADLAEAAWFLVTGPLANGTQLFVDSGQHLLSQPRDVLYAVREGA